ncbi:MAG: RloB domain-containing protein [Candidatus Moranbacteria bacterium]|nr:RloB domain-containing protein [Candidatus Moranbacteria bacterium]
MTKYRGTKKHRGPTHPKVFVWVHTKRAEPEYFRAFKNHHELHRLIVYRAKGCLTPQSLIDYVIAWRKLCDEYSEADGDRIWCVVDVDDFLDTEEDKQEVLRAVRRANIAGIRIGYANECFELWILLHFVLPTAPIERGKDIEKRIQDVFKKVGLGLFQKNDDIFQRLLPFQEQAVQNSSKLLSNAEYEAIRWESALGKNGNPSTNIHMLVDDIQKLIV